MQWVKCHSDGLLQTPIIGYLILKNASQWKELNYSAQIRRSPEQLPLLHSAQCGRDRKIKQKSSIFRSVIALQ